jgi:pimeloyl-ACP methyl ester carboxylesterase
MAAEQPPGQWFMENGALERRLRAIRSLRRVAVADAGHMLHHDQPGRIASLIEEFLR